jgi:hypothetical protein
MFRGTILIVGWILSGIVSAESQAGEGSVPARPASGSQSSDFSFSHDVRPILSANCFACHGPDEESREAELRLDERESAVDYGAIVPGDAAASLLVERISADDSAVVMPPPDSGHSLTGQQIELLTRWISEGAEYTPHWSFIPPQRPELPPVAADDWPTNGIDDFILQRLEEAGLSPAPNASPHVLVRRVYLDLIGLPPLPGVADEFAADPSPEAYERLVDELLSSPRFGEHWAREWLDLARYADTKGYEKDLPRDMWPYRDWLIRALNEDMPYDQFTIEQLAGDLLPSPTREQIIASAFHRNTMNNDEGGTDDEEFRVAAVKDRVDTTMQVWMGLTAGCAKCHSHKFDPISHEEYYQLFAIFNQTADADTFDEAPVMRFETPGVAEQISALRRKIDERKKAEAGNSDETKKLDEQLKELEAKVTKLPIMRELEDDKRRTTRIHVRGNFLDPGEEVSPAVPAAFGELAGDVPEDRLALARWLVSKDNPLTPRVAANRVWARFFGAGLVQTEEDFGSQGAPPSHPLLLDWLATEFRDTHQWSLKKLCNTIVMSSTYRQSSVVEEEKRQADPQNRLLGRGPRFRLPAEAVRDQALAAAGLLSTKMYGPPVMPPQPPGVWKTIYNTRKWETSAGQDRYRRALYTYWKRTSPYPSMLIFDAEGRDVCAIRRIHTNTPLQALVLMNDPVYLEAAAALARRMVEEGGEAAAQRIERGLRLLLIRPADSLEIERLNQLQLAAAGKFRAQAALADALLAACNADERLPDTLEPHEFAAYVVVASTILNLDESVKRN